MNTIRKYLFRISLVVAVAACWGLTSCDDGVASENYRTYDVEMLSDYLRNRPEFSKFTQVVTKAGLMDLFSTYGQYTCFVPTDSAMNAYFRSIGISSVDELSVADCDTLARTAIVNRIYGLPELASVALYLGKNNMLDQPIKVESVPVIENGDTINSTYRINGQGTIIIELANDSVENGIVHPVNGLIEPLRDLLPTLMKKDESISIFNTCLEMTGLDRKMMRFRDESYNAEDWEHLNNNYQTGAANQKPYFEVPEYRYYGYTAFAVPDSILKEVYGYTKWEDLYDYAKTIYTDGAPNVFTDESNALYQLIAYHVLDRKGLYDKLTTYVTIYTGDLFPTEWYSTMAPHTTIKVEMINGKYASINKNKGSAEIGNLYLNRHYNSRETNPTDNEQRGAKVSRTVKPGLSQNATNGVYYYIDRLEDYGEKTQRTVFNNRMRIDLYTIWPEMMNNDIRSDNPKVVDVNNMSARDPESLNFIFPPGYLDDTESDPDGRFLYQNAHRSFWSYEGDEYNLNSSFNTFDITFPLPSVPEGDYQIRLGFAPMDFRAIAQMYFDGVPQGIPLDMRFATVTAKLGTDYYGFSSTPTGESWEQSKKDLHNLGWYHGPCGIRCTGSVSGDNDFNLSSGDGSSFNQNGGHTMRKVIYQGHITADKKHTLRMKSVWAGGTAQLMIDYIEIVPKSLYGVEGDGKGEDDL